MYIQGSEQKKYSRYWVIIKKCNKLDKIYLMKIDQAM